MSKILIFAHGHPDFSMGGGELAAYQMFNELRKRPNRQAVFVARIDPTFVEKAITQLRDDEFVIASQSEFFRYSNSDEHLLLETLPELLRRIEPDVVHFHHFVHLGLEFIRVVKNVLPSASIFLTLHEYLAICNNNGQMITRHGDLLCRRSSSVACNRCFPEISVEDFFLREQIIKTYFDEIDGFIAPSRFLKDRFVDWGISPDRICVIENGQTPAPRLPPRRLSFPDERRGRFAFLGQIHRFKGIDILLEAFELIPPDLRSPKGPISLAIHGVGLEAQSKEFQMRVSAQMQKLEGTVRMYGRYEPDDLPAIMVQTDWVVMPSIWWENSPIVIQEARNFGRPLIVSGIGGMAEKVQHEIDGIHSRPRDPRSLADALLRATFEDGLWEKCSQSARRPIEISETVDEVLELYRSVSDNRSGRPKLDRRSCS
jgi:glycosyltransferase involved in cell wall biosynthesis